MSSAGPCSQARGPRVCGCGVGKRFWGSGVCSGAAAARSPGRGCPAAAWPWSSRSASAAASGDPWARRRPRPGPGPPARRSPRRLTLSTASPPPVCQDGLLVLAAGQSRRSRSPTYQPTLKPDTTAPTTKAATDDVTSSRFTDTSPARSSERLAQGVLGGERGVRRAARTLPCILLPRPPAGLSTSLLRGVSLTLSKPILPIRLSPGICVPKICPSACLLASLPSLPSPSVCPFPTTSIWDWGPFPSPEGRQCIPPIRV